MAIRSQPPALLGLVKNIQMCAFASCQIRRAQRERFLKVGAYLQGGEIHITFQCGFQLQLVLISALGLLTRGGKT